MEPVVYIVPCVDTEGPLDESLEATFRRIHHVSGIVIEPSVETLARLRRREIDLKGWEDTIAVMVDSHVLNYNNTWEKIDSMLREMTSIEFRRKYLDSFGGEMVYNWFLVDHMDYYTGNPRKREIGYGKIFDHYRTVLDESSLKSDGIHFHFHPIPISKQAHHNATHWFANSDSLMQILCRRVIEHGWFPSCNRPGFNVTSPESHWFLEQFVPFDYANQFYREAPEVEGRSDEKLGISEWSRAPDTWGPYHPDHDDYQTPGSCRRWIFRCLNIGSRHKPVRQADVDSAFEEAASGKSTVLAFAGHDFRDLRADIASVHAMLLDATRKYPTVKFRNSEARAACRAALNLSDHDLRPKASFDLEISGGRLRVTSRDRIFGPQPWLAIKTKQGVYHHDNMEIREPFRRWSYGFHEETVPLSDLAAVGIAACDAAGNSYVARWDAESGEISQVVG